MRRALPLLLAVAALAGCGGSGSDEPPVAAPPAAAAEAVHVHGLGVDPADGALLVATHRGLFRAAPGAERVQRVGDRTPDLMGFTVAGRDRYLASGHPDVRDDLPPHLGLMESRDGGRTWDAVSLLGEADFHLLEVRGDTVYGGDAAGGRFVRSEDGGETWQDATLPAPTFDVAVHPVRGDTLLASTEEGLFASRDGARTWTRLGEGSGQLAWLEPQLVVLVGAGGAVLRSTDGGRTLEEATPLGGDAEAVLAAGSSVYAALHDGRVLESSDAGTSWSVRARL